MSSVLDEQRRILTTVFQATSGPAWSNSAGWNTEAPLETWFRVSVEKENGYVVTLALNYNGLRGSIPPQLGQLSNLRELWLNGNSLEGNIPPALGDLKNLQVLALYENELTGNIPPELGDLQNLQGLYLNDNKLTGSIPPELGSLQNLKVLNLFVNRLTGPIPAALIERLEVQITSYNFEGNMLSLPEDIGTQTHLTKLDLSRQGLVGSIPTELGSLQNLEMLKLSGNQLSGSIPRELGSLEGLVRLALDNNQLTGTIPPQLGELSHLRVLWLSGNNLEGNIPPELGSLENLKRLALQRNRLTGNIPKELGELTELLELKLGWNKLDGSIPPELGGLEKLENLDLFNNELTGNIPLELGSLEKLGRLSLASNKLTGNLPKELGDLTHLSWLWLHYNKLTGPIPAALIGRLEVQITNCVFTGNALSLPDDIGTQTHLIKLDLSHQGLVGTIPPQLGELSHLRDLDLSRNNLEGSIPPQLGQLSHLRELKLHQNSLEGFATGTSEDWILLFCPGKSHYFRVQDNPLQYPPVGVLLQGRHMTQKYFDDLRKCSKEVRSLKAMLLGPTTVGKTSLMRSIIEGRPTAVEEENPSTVGVHVEGCELKTSEGSVVSCRFFDCGGQQDYHGLSSMFMTEGAAYLLVWSPPDDPNGDKLEPFFEMLKHGASKSTALGVANKCDQWKGAQSDLTARCTSFHSLVKEQLRKGRITLGEGVHMTSCEKEGGREQELKVLIEKLTGLGQTYVVGPLLEKAVALLDRMAKGHIFLTMGEVEEAWKVELQKDGNEDEDKELADVMLQCGVNMLDRNGRLVVAGGVEKGAAIVLSEAALFSKLISPLLTPADAITSDGEEVLLGRNEGPFTPPALKPLKPKRQVDDDDGLKLDRRGANQLKDGVLTVGFARSVWNAVLLREGGDGGRTFDEQQEKALLGRLVNLGIIFEKAQHDNAPGGVNGGGNPAEGQELQFVVSLRMPDAMDSSNGRAQELRKAAIAISKTMKECEYLKQLYLQLERPPSPGTIARLVSTLSTKGLGEVAVGWRQGALFVAAQEAYMAFVSYDWTKQRLYLKVAGLWEEGEKQCDSFPTVAMGLLLRHTVHHLSSYKCRWKAVYVVKDMKEKWEPLCEGDLQELGCVLDRSREAEAGTNEPGPLSEQDVEGLIATPVPSPRWAPPTLATGHFGEEWKTVRDKFEGEAFGTLRTCVNTFTKNQESLRKAREELLKDGESLVMKDDTDYQVFLSHAGTEKRGIVSLLHRCLWQRGIPTFLDERSLEAGDRAEDKMLQVADTAPIGVVVLSPSFVRREWPLQEMKIFMERAKKGEATLVPLFFGLTVEECWNTQLLQKNHILT